MPNQTTNRLPIGRKVRGAIAAASGLALFAGCQRREPLPRSRPEASSTSAAVTQGRAELADAILSHASGRESDPVPGRLGDGTLLRQLRSAAEEERRRALEDLRHIGWYYHAGTPRRPDEAMTPIVDTLGGMIRDHREPLRLEAIDVLRWLSAYANDGSQMRAVRQALPGLVAIASDPRQDEQLRAHAVDAMQWLGAEAVPALAKVLFDRAATLQLRLLAARALKWSETGRRELRRAIDSPGLHALVRGAALEGVCEGGGPECASLTGHPDPEVRVAVAGSVAGKSGDPQQLSELASALRDPARRPGALVAVENLRARGTPVLIEALGSSDPDLRLLAVRSLGRLREGAKGAVPALRRLQQEAPDPLRTAAAQALEQIGPPLREIAAGLGAPPPAGERAFALLAMSARAMGELAAEVIPDLRRALRDPDPRVRAQAASVLGDFKVPQQPERWNGLAAGSPLAVFKAAARDAMPDLIAALRDPDPAVRGNAALAFQVLLPSQEAGAASHGPVQALLGALDDAQDSVRRDALQALGMLAINRRLAAEDSDEARRVMAALQGALQDRSPEVSSLAAHWLKMAKAASRRP